MRKILLLSCLSFSILSTAFAQNPPDTLLHNARVLIDQERCNEAALIYEKILETDLRNYESYVFLGSYYYLLGKQAVESAEIKYKSIAQPNHMQMAHYQDELKKIYYEDYEKSNTYLLKAIEINKNDHLLNLLASIQSYKERIGLVPVTKRKK